MEAIPSRSLNRLLENERARLLRMKRTELGMVRRLVWNVLKPLRSSHRYQHRDIVVRTGQEQTHRLRSVKVK
jgi:hypothetical protein